MVKRYGTPYAISVKSRENHSRNLPLVQDVCSICCNCNETKKNKLWFMTVGLLYPFKSIIWSQWPPFMVVSWNGLLHWVYLRRILEYWCNQWVGKEYSVQASNSHYLRMEFQGKLLFWPHPSSSLYLQFDKSFQLYMFLLTSDHYH